MKICILNVQLPLPPSLFVTRDMIQSHHDSKSKEDLKGTPAILTKSHVSAETLIRVGDPAQTIVQVARQKHCGEIVMGTRGLGSLKGLLLGSVTTKVIHLSKIPVTVVP
jgi:nucleotide-binding universal stress UspA family protein